MITTISLFLSLCHVVCGVLFPGLGIEPAPPVLEAQSLNHWIAREVPSTFFFLLMRTFKTYSLNNFQIYSTLLLTIVIMLYITASGLNYFLAGHLYLLTPFTHFTHPPPSSASNSCQSVLWVFEFSILGFCFSVSHMRSYGICLSLSDFFHLA